MLTLSLLMRNWIKKDYGFEIEYEKAKELKCTFLPNGVAGFIELIKILEDIENYDFVELPPLDSLREVIYGAYIVFKAKTKKVKTGYFWENGTQHVKCSLWNEKLKT